MNLLLVALPAHEFERVLPALEVVSVTLKQFLHKAGEPIEHVYFPGDGFCSDLTVLEDVTMVEVATIGREGLVGVEAVVDGGVASSAIMVQADMESCYRMPAEAFRGQMVRRGAFCDVMTRYAQALVGVVKQWTDHLSPGPGRNRGS